MGVKKTVTKYQRSYWNEIVISCFFSIKVNAYDLKVTNNII